MCLLSTRKLAKAKGSPKDRHHFVTQPAAQAAHSLPASVPPRLADRRLIGRGVCSARSSAMFANSAGAFAGSNIARSSAEHCAAKRALAASASAAAFLSARASSRAFAAALRSCRCCFGFSRHGRTPAENEVDVIVDAAGIFGRGAILDQHQPVGGQLDHVAVVADEDDGAVIAVERLDQRLARIDVEVVGRLVEDQQVRRIARDQRQRQPRALAARELADERRRLVARKSRSGRAAPGRRRGCCRSSRGSCAGAACRRRAVPRPGIG